MVFSDKSDGGVEVWDLSNESRIGSFNQETWSAEPLNLNTDDTNDWSEIQVSLDTFNIIIIEIEKEIKAFEEDTQNIKLNKLLKEKTFLAHKEKLEARYNDIEKLHNNLIWVNKANKFNKQTFKSQSTKTEKRLSQEYFNIDYRIKLKNVCWLVGIYCF